MNRPNQHNACPRPSPTFNRQQHKRRGKDPRDFNGMQLQCNIFESMYHVAQNCLEKHDLYYTQEVTLFQSDFDHPEKIKNLAPESWNAEVLDSRPMDTVVGEKNGTNVTKSV